MLEKIGVSEKIVRIIQSMYEFTIVSYSLGDLETVWVECRRGIRQGCMLSPLLFGVYRGAIGQDEEVRPRYKGWEGQTNFKLQMMPALKDSCILDTREKTFHEFIIHSAGQWCD